MIDLYTWPTPNGHKVQIMLEETGREYRIHPVDLGEKEQFEPEFLAISPSGKIPAIVDDDGPGGGELSIFESGGILLYLAENSGMFLPPDPNGRWEVISWLMFQMGGIGPMLGQAGYFLNKAPKPVPAAHRTLHPRDGAPLRSGQPPSCRGRIPGRRLLDRRHR